MDFRRVGSFRQRQKNADRTTWQHQEHQKKRVAEKTHEAIELFEQHLRATTRGTAEVDDLPISAEAGALHGALRRSYLAQMRDNASDTSSARNLNILRSASEVHLHGSGGGHHSGPDIDHKHVRRPPSPLGIYNYGCISTRPRSVLAQRRCKTGDSTRPKHRQSTPGMYFPGAECRQGIYGFSMLDPIHISPKAWEHGGKEPPLRWEGQPADLRPATTPAARPKTGGQTHSEIVRGTRGHTIKANHVFHSMDKRDAETTFEQACFEHGTYEASSAHKMLRERGTSMLEPPPPQQHDWVGGHDDDLEGHQRIASMILFGLEATLREGKAKLSHIFKAVTRSPGVLEPADFLEGLMRIGLADDPRRRPGREHDPRRDPPQLSIHDCIEAMLTLDPHFDGRINLVALDRAIAEARGVQKQRTQQLLQQSQEHQAKVSQSYSQHLPFDVVKIEHKERSLFDFERAFQRFRKQQRELLEHHGEVSKCEQRFDS